MRQLVTVVKPRSPAAEAYRTLRTNLRFSGVDRPVRTVLFTSSVQDEGKSTVLANLGVAAAQAGTRVALLDCDLRRPSLHEIFELPNSTGFTSLFLEDSDEPPLQTTAVPGLCVLSSGPLPPNPADLLASERFDAAIEAMQRTVDLVLVDSPPAAVVADASIIAPRLDGVVLVVDSRRTRRDKARRAQEQLERVHARILGVVLNNVRGGDEHYG
jgi:non-specific protein-tyrosine kinase